MNCKDIISRSFKAFTALLLLVAAVGILSPDIHVKADDKFAFESSDLILYVGNEYSYAYIIENYIGHELERYGNGSVDYWNLYYEYYSYVIVNSSNNDVVRDDDDKFFLKAVSKGTADITLQFNGQTAKCHITVKANGCSNDKDELTVLTGEPFTLKMNNKKKAVEYSYKIYDSTGRYVKNYGYQAENRGKGNYKFTITDPGEFVIETRVLAENGRLFTAYTKVTVERCGPEKDVYSVAVGHEMQLTLLHAKMVSAEVVNYWWEEPKDTECFTLSKKGVVKGLQEGDEYVKITYKDENGTVGEETVHVYVTNPVYEPFKSAFILNEGSRSINYSGASYYSEVVAYSDDESIIQVENSSYGSYLIPQKTGKCKIRVVIDGVEFKETINVIDPVVEFGNSMLLADQTRQIKVTGIAESTKVKYSSSDESIVTVSKKGLLTAKGTGNAYITVAIGIGGYEVGFAVTVVSSDTALAAVRAGEAVLGAAYDRDKRMQTGYYDCSSFVWRSYKEAGVYLKSTSYAPTAADLAKYLEDNGYGIATGYVDPDNLLPGDLIFYTGTDGRYKNIGHVSMYYGPNYVDGWGGTRNVGTIIHAVGRGVCTTTYSTYETGKIVVIARPIQ